MRSTRIAWLAGLALFAGQAQTNYIFYSIIGQPPSPVFGPAYTFDGTLFAIAADFAGNVYASYEGPIWKIDPRGNMSPMAGFGASVAPAHGQPVYALEAQVEYYGAPCGDAQGNLYLAGHRDLPSLARWVDVGLLNGPRRPSGLRFQRQCLRRHSGRADPAHRKRWHYGAGGWHGRAR